MQGAGTGRFSFDKIGNDIESGWNTIKSGYDAINKKGDELEEKLTNTADKIENYVIEKKKIENAADKKEKYVKSKEDIGIKATHENISDAAQNLTKEWAGNKAEIAVIDRKKTLAKAAMIGGFILIGAASVILVLGTVAAIAFCPPLGAVIIAGAIIPVFAITALAAGSGAGIWGMYAHFKDDDTMTKLRENAKVLEECQKHFDKDDGFYEYLNKFKPKGEGADAKYTLEDLEKIEGSFKTYQENKVLKNKKNELDTKLLLNELKQENLESQKRGKKGEKREIEERLSHDQLPDVERESLDQAIEKIDADISRLDEEIDQLAGEKEELDSEKAALGEPKELTLPNVARFDTTPVANPEKFLRGCEDEASGKKFVVRPDPAIARDPQDGINNTRWEDYIREGEGFAEFMSNFTPKDGATTFNATQKLGLLDLYDEAKYYAADLNKIKGVHREDLARAGLAEGLNERLERFESRLDRVYEFCDTAKGYEPMTVEKMLSLVNLTEIPEPQREEEDKEFLEDIEDEEPLQDHRQNRQGQGVPAGDLNNPLGGVPTGGQILLNPTALPGHNNTQPPQQQPHQGNVQANPNQQNPQGAPPTQNTTQDQ